MIDRPSPDGPLPGFSAYISSILESVASPATWAAKPGRVAAAARAPRNTDQKRASAIQKQGSATTRRGTATSSDRNQPSRLNDSIR